jgi:hypothetical protein
VEDQFVTSAAGGVSILIESRPPRNPNDDTPDFAFSVRNKDDREVFSLYNGGYGVEYTNLKALHEAARRSALNIDKTINGILEDLKRET